MFGQIKTAMIMQRTNEISFRYSSFQNSLPFRLLSKYLQTKILSKQAQHVFQISGLGPRLLRQCTRRKGAATNYHYSTLADVAIKPLSLVRVCRMQLLMDLTSYINHSLVARKSSVACDYVYQCVAWIPYMSARLDTKQ